METQINSLVYDYLSAVSPKVAKKFKEVAKPEELPAGNKVIINHTSFCQYLFLVSFFHVEVPKF